MNTPEMIERAARAIDPNAFELFDRLKGRCSEALILRLKEARSLARAALTAALGDTHVVVRMTPELERALRGTGAGIVSHVTPDVRDKSACVSPTVIPTPAEKGGEG